MLARDAPVLVAFFVIGPLAAGNAYQGLANLSVYCVGNGDRSVSQTAKANIWSFFNTLK